MREAEPGGEQLDVLRLSGQDASLCVNTQLCPERCRVRMLRRQLSAHFTVCSHRPIRCNDANCTQLHPPVEFIGGAPAAVPALPPAVAASSPPPPPSPSISFVAPSPACPAVIDLTAPAPSASSPPPPFPALIPALEAKVVGALAPAPQATVPAATCAEPHAASATGTTAAGGGSGQRRPPHHPTPVPTAASFFTAATPTLCAPPNALRCASRGPSASVSARPQPSDRRRRVTSDRLLCQVLRRRRTHPHQRCSQRHNRSLTCPPVTTQSPPCRHHHVTAVFPSLQTPLRGGCSPPSSVTPSSSYDAPASTSWSATLPLPWHQPPSSTTSASATTSTTCTRAGAGAGQQQAAGQDSPGGDSTGPGARGRAGEAGPVERERGKAPARAARGHCMDDERASKTEAADCHGGEVGGAAAAAPVDVADAAAAVSAG